MATKRRTWVAAPRGGTKKADQNPLLLLMPWKGKHGSSRTLGESRQQSFPATPPKDADAPSCSSSFDDNADDDDGRDYGDSHSENHRSPRLSLRDIFGDTTKVAGTADESYPIATQTTTREAVPRHSMKVTGQLRTWKGKSNRNLGERRQSFPSTPDKTKDARSSTPPLFDGNVDGPVDGDCRFQNSQLQPRISFRDIFESTMPMADGDSGKASFATTQHGHAGETRPWVCCLDTAVVVYGPKNWIQHPRNKIMALLLR